MEQSETRIQTYEEFWPFYLSQHKKRSTQIIHTVGLVIALGVVAYALASGHYALALLFPVIGYGFAWTSHFLIEHNRPATWKYPAWSFISEFRLAFRVITKGPWR